MDKQLSPTAESGTEEAEEISSQTKQLIAKMEAHIARIEQLRALIKSSYPKAGDSQAYG